MIEKINADVPDDLLVAVLFAEMGVTSCPLPRRKGRRARTLRHYNRLLDAIETTRLSGMLDLIVDYADLLRESDWQNSNDVAEIVAHLIVRAIDEAVIGPDQGQMLWRWLGVIQHARQFHRDIKKDLVDRLSTHDNLRHGVQSYAFEYARIDNSLWVTEMDLQGRLVGVSTRTHDLVWALDQLANGGTNDPALREDWCDLMRLACSPEGLDPAVRKAAERFRRGDTQLGAFLRKLENPKKPAWEVKQEKDAAKYERKRRAAFAADRRQFENDRTNLRAGVFNAILKPAQAYFGSFSDLSRDQPPIERVAEWLGPELRGDALIGFEAVLHRNDLPTAAGVCEGFAKGVTYNFCFPLMAGLFERMRIGKGIADISLDLKILGLLLCYNDDWGHDDDLPTLIDALEAAALPTQDAREAFARLWIEPSLFAGCEHVAGLYKLANDPKWQATGGAVAAGWLMRFPEVPDAVEMELVNCLTHSGALGALRDVAEVRATNVFRNFDHLFAWLAIDVLVRFEAVIPDLFGVGARNPEFIWFLRNRFQLNRHGAISPIDVTQAKWIISEFRMIWPYSVLDGSGSGDTNSYDAADFLRALLGRLADNSSLEASAALGFLIGQPKDSYSDLIRHMAAEQLQKRAEENFSALAPMGLGQLLTDGPPFNIDDLKSLVLEEIAVAQAKLVGDDIDQVRDFWGDAGIPYDENRCRDRLAAMIGPELARYDVQRLTEADMPKTKRADLAFARGQLQLPMEVKGQWHGEVWDAAIGQLDAQYLIDWRSEQRGIYCILWFGDLLAASGRRLKALPKGIVAPKTADEMRRVLVERIPDARRALIDVVVLDLTAGKPRTETVGGI